MESYLGRFVTQCNTKRRNLS